MYASFFGLRELPFNNTPDPRFFFSTPDHEEALASLIYAVAQGKGFMLLTGEVGAGKTLVSRLLLRHFGDKITFAAVNNTQISADELLRSVCAEFSIDTPEGASNVDLIRRLQDFLLRNFAGNKPVVLMLDEAQALSRGAFEQIRMIGNLEADDAKLLQIIIVGQPELRERFEARDMRQLRQRIFRSFHLSALTREQTSGYVLHRLSVAGAPYPDRVFDTRAIDTVHEFSQGLPRLINSVCDNAMLSAYAADQSTIDHDFVNQVIGQMMSVTKPESADHGNEPIVATREESPQRANETHLRNAPVTTAMAGMTTAAGIATTTGMTATTAGTGMTAAAGMAMTMPKAAQLRDQLSDEFARRLQHAQREHTRRLEEEIEKIRSELDDSRAAVVAKSAPMRRQAQQLAHETRQILHEAKETLTALREATAIAKRAETATQNTAAKLVAQSTSAGKLCVNLRSVYSRLEAGTEAIEKRVNTARTSRRTPEPPPQKRHMLKQVQRLDRAINNSRDNIKDVRNLIAATTAAVGIGKTDLTHIIGNKGDSQRRSSNLAKQVRELSELVTQSRQHHEIRT